MKRATVGANSTFSHARIDAETEEDGKKLSEKPKEKKKNAQPFS